MSGESSSCGWKSSFTTEKHKKSFHLYQWRQTKEFPNSVNDCRKILFSYPCRKHEKCMYLFMYVASKGYLSHVLGAFDHHLQSVELCMMYSLNRNSWSFLHTIRGKDNSFSENTHNSSMFVLLEATLKRGVEYLSIKQKRSWGSP